MNSPMSNPTTVSATGLPALDQLAEGLGHAELSQRLGEVLNYTTDHIASLGKLVDHHLDALEAIGVGDPVSGIDRPTAGAWSRVDRYIAETCHLVLLASRAIAPTDPLRALLDVLAGELAPLVRGDHARVKILRFPWLATSTGHIYLSAAGYPDPDHNRLVSATLASGLTDAWELSPTGALARWWRTKTHTGRPDAVNDDLIRGSILDRDIAPIYMLTDEQYTLTHALWYVTDYGADSAPAGLDVHRIQHAIDALLAVNLAAGDLDLSVEFLMCAAVLRQPWSPHARLAWRQITSALDEQGHLPGPRFAAVTDARLDGHARRRYRFWTCHHPTQVAGKLFSILLRHPEHSVTAANTVNADAALRCTEAVDPALIDSCRQAARITHATSTTGPAVRMRDIAPDHPAVLGSMVAADDLDTWGVVLDGALMRAGRTYDLSRLADLLRCAAAAQAPPSPTVLQAVAFLLRQHAHARCQDIELTGRLGACFADLTVYLASGNDLHHRQRTAS